MSASSDVPNELHDKVFNDLTPHELYGILRLRSEIFVVEQDCVYGDLDGRDELPSVRHIWFTQDRRIVAACRLLNEGSHREIGRIVTDKSARGNGLAAKMIDYCFATSDGPWHIAAQAYLQQWYEGFGFVRSGNDYLEDGIPHLPMIRPA